MNEQQAWEVLRTVEDPELGMDVVTLGLIYELKISGNQVNIQMTYTTPMCPYGPAMKQEIIDKLKKLEKNTSVHIEITFDPPWQPTEEVKAMLGIN